MIGCLFFVARHLWQINPYRQTQEVVQLAHPLCVTVGQIVIDSYDVNALARECIQVHRQGGRQRLALSSSHFGNFAVVQRHATQQLDIEMAHLHDTLGTFADHGKSFRQERVQWLPIADALPEFQRLSTQFIIRQLFELNLHRVDACDARFVLFEQAVITTAEDFCQNIDGHECKTIPPPTGVSGQCNPFSVKRDMRLPKRNTTAFSGICSAHSAELAILPLPEQRLLGQARQTGGRRWRNAMRRRPGRSNLGCGNRTTCIQEFLGVLRHTFHPHLKMQMRPSGTPRCSHFRNLLTTFDQIASFN